MITKYGTETLLCDIPDAEFETGWPIGEAIKQAGYVDGAKSVIGAHNWWGLTVGQLAQTLAHQPAVQ